MISENKKKSHFKLWIIIGIAAIILIAGSAITYEVKNRYEYISPKKGKIVEAIYGLGKVKSRRQYEVKIGVMSKVKKVYVEEGQKVKMGDSLVAFDDSGIFKAPFNGTVTNIVYRPPQTVLPQTTVLSMEDLADKYIEVSLEQEGALRVKEGQQVKILFESLRGNVFKGKVQAIFPKNEEFITHIEVEGLGAEVLPGMTADVSITVSTHDDALLVPVSGVSNGVVLVKRENNKKEKIAIRIGSVDGAWAEVLEGDIKLTDKVVTKKAKK
ncbi:MAG: HlyD family efflux transporter periplasmic adaptor subunit [Deltaproteobacteria bacterium]|nr:MAG: HlyD family efflux transporter periplasmic adaptor subunit [Deltaproteobacteria bacterium]